MLWTLLELDMALGAIFCLLSVLCLISGTHIYELKCWTQSNVTRYIGSGLQNTAIDDTVECINKCREFNSCRIVNIDTNTKGKCWYRANGSVATTLKDVYIDNFETADTVTSYMYDHTCGEITRGVDLNCWAVDAYRKAEALTQIDRKTAEECLSECKSRRFCWEVNWDMNTSPSCWIQTSAFAQLTLKPSMSATNFARNRDCLKLIAGLDMRFWRVSALTCYKSPGLVEDNTLGLQSCLNYCQSNKNCNMVEYNLQTRHCWIQTKPFPILRGKLVEADRCHNFLLLREEYEASLGADKSLQ